MSTATTTNAFAGLGDMLAGGFDTMLASDASEQMVSLDDIEIAAQDREEFEDAENTLADLGQSLRMQQAQAILLRPNRPGATRPYLLVAGERRVRAARIEGLQELRARIKPMSDEEAQDVQFAENVHRKNLTQIEEAKRLQRDLDQLGSVEAVLAKHKKSRAWLSKNMALLQLPAEAKRLVTEGISADVEVITSVRTIETKDPKRAAALVDELKHTRGKESARDKVGAVKDEMRSAKKPAKSADTGSVATPRDRRQEAAGQGAIFAPAKADEKPTRVPSEAEILERVYAAIFEDRKAPTSVLNALPAEQSAAMDTHLRTFYEAGKQAVDPAQAVIQGFRGGRFACDGSGAFALVAFLHGADRKAKFNLLNVAGCLKP